MKQRLSTLIPALGLAVSLTILGPSVPLTAQSGQPAVPTAVAASSVPRLVRFAGWLKGETNNPVAGVVGVTFALYEEQTGGVPLWLETQNVQSDSNGHYSVQLGSTKPDGLATELFTSGEARWLGVRAEGQSEQPRVLLLSVPYALKAGDAETLGGLPVSAFALAKPATSGTGSPSNNRSEVNPAAATPAVGTAVALTTVIHDKSLKGGGTATSPLGMTVPMSLTSSSPLAGTITAINTNTGIGVHAAAGGKSGFASNAGMWGESSTRVGVQGSSGNQAGILGESGTGTGVQGITFGSNSTGVYGIQTGASGIAGIAGVWGDSNSVVGVFGTSSAAQGVIGQTSNAFPAVQGVNGGVGDGLQGVNGSNAGGTGVRGLSGVSSELSASPAGVVGDSRNQAGVIGLSLVTDGVMGISGGSSGLQGSNPGTFLNTAGVYGSAGDGSTFSGIAGVWGNSADHVGTFGTSTNFAGVQGQSTNGPGVFGSSSKGFGIATDGNVQQTRGGGGWVKALAYINPTLAGNAAIIRCYNSQASGAAVSTPPCGFTFYGNDVSTGILDFGFRVSDRFVSVTTSSSTTDVLTTVCLNDQCPTVTANQISISTIGTLTDCDGTRFCVPGLVAPYFVQIF